MKTPDIQMLRRIVVWSILGDIEARVRSGAQRGANRSHDPSRIELPESCKGTLCPRIIQAGSLRQGIECRLLLVRSPL
jgi:hypothetical protein